MNQVSNRPKRHKSKTFSQSGVGIQPINPIMIRTPGAKVSKSRVNSNANLRPYIQNSATRFSGNRGSILKKTRHTKSTLNSAFNSRGGLYDRITPKAAATINLDGGGQSMNSNQLTTSLFKGNMT